MSNVKFPSLAAALVLFPALLAAPSIADANGVLGCRVTGGRVSALGETNPTSFFEIQRATGGGQVGAPCGAIGCFDDFDHIQGNWQHSRKKKSGTFHAKDYNTLFCECRAGDGNESGGTVCDPNNPRPGDVNAACFSGVGDYSATGIGKKTQRVVFRVEVEDHGEPGAGGDAPSDVYRIRIWIPNGEDIKDLAEGACCCKPTPTNRLANIDDGGNIIHGNIQIHPQLPNTQDPPCPVTDEDCQAQLCGNGHHDPGEECDATNASAVCANGHPCLADCTCEQPSCGDGIRDPGEDCDDRNTEPCDGCSATCTTERCGDGVTCASQSEECDDGNTDQCDGCSPTCRNETCGDGVVCASAGEQCDPPEEESAACPGSRDCLSDCTCVPPRCGDGILDAGEDCDGQFGCPGGLQCSDNCVCPTPFCGDNVCSFSAGEDSTSCCQDCGGCVCFPDGGLCCVGETCEPSGICRSGSGTTCYECSCSDSCDPFPCPSCGDGTCETGEDGSNCPADCPSCGDGTCDAGESALNCAADCGCAAAVPDACTVGSRAPNNACGCDCDALLDDNACPDMESLCGYGGYCGDGTCATGCETSANCLTDCPTCGDGTCDAGIDEDTCTCPGDCGSGDPDSCESCECFNNGGTGSPGGGTCSCDPYTCQQNGNCCPNTCTVCLACE